jgi:hypothetical protein
MTRAPFVRTGMQPPCRRGAENFLVALPANGFRTRCSPDRIRALTRSGPR